MNIILLLALIGAEPQEDPIRDTVWYLNRTADNLDWYKSRRLYQLRTDRRYTRGDFDRDMNRIDRLRATDINAYIEMEKIVSQQKQRHSQVQQTTQSMRADQIAAYEKRDIFEPNKVQPSLLVHPNFDHYNQIMFWYTKPEEYRMRYPQSNSGSSSSYGDLGGY